MGRAAVTNSIHFFQGNLKVRISICVSDQRLYKESSMVTAFSWSNVSSENQGGVTKRSKMDDKVVVMDFPPRTPKKQDQSSESRCA